MPSTEENESNLVTSRQQEICARRKRAREAQAQQAERMVKRSRIDLKAGEIADNVAVPIPMVDRGRGDPRNILGVILDRIENDLYRITVKEGVLKTKYTRTEFALCPQHLLTIDDVNTTDMISLREAMRKAHLGVKDSFVVAALVLDQKSAILKDACASNPTLSVIVVAITACHVPTNTWEIIRSL